MFNELVTSKGFTGYALSKKSGVPQSTISDLMIGKTDIYNAKWITIIKICKALKITSEQLNKNIKKSA